MKRLMTLLLLGVLLFVGCKKNDPESQFKRIANKIEKDIPKLFHEEGNTFAFEVTATGLSSTPYKAKIDFASTTEYEGVTTVHTISTDYVFEEDRWRCIRFTSHTVENGTPKSEPHVLEEKQIYELYELGVDCDPLIMFCWMRE